eukprot:CAMPEP_0170526246 /NCGR_PEP_ID=MMETSP0209-20121228/11697_1 /TAXON_ID=665100 ORGANISM="Litonotus pictus, Strain P1" /NCGR_SAMPLE_ID=MMETSP0209 /ASSEMBLY_ACC=CAM_ASM_000301 /LENGTH=190 /DNA_ID=CAMNT_0010815977 /DNA_START=81 /DNA_END=653 /DNA_ORIENTATION=+
MDSTAMRNNLQEFYKTSKDKLLKLKAEIEEIETDNEKQLMENQLQESKIVELEIQNNQISKENKENRVTIMELNKEKASLTAQNRELKKEIEEIDKDIETIKLDNQYKIKVLQNDIEHINIMKETNLKILKNKETQEQMNEDKLNLQIKEYMKEIQKYKNLIEELHEQDNERNKLIVQETVEMTKFLENL